MVKRPMMLTHTVCHRYCGIILAAVITAIRSDHLIEKIVAEAWLKKYLNA